MSSLLGRCWSIVARWMLEAAAIAARRVSLQRSRNLCRVFKTQRRHILLAGSTTTNKVPHQIAACCLGDPSPALSAATTAEWAASLLGASSLAYSIERYTHTSKSRTYYLVIGQLCAWPLPAKGFVPRRGYCRRASVPPLTLGPTG